MPSDNWLHAAQKDSLWKQAIRTFYKATWEPIKLKSKYEEMTYFNNPKKFVAKSNYDAYREFSSFFPIYDQRKKSENKQALQDIRNNIYEQECKKAVPIVTSFNYGRRKPLEPTETMFNRCNQIRSFYRRNGVYPPAEKIVSTNIHSKTEQ